MDTSVKNISIFLKDYNNHALPYLHVSLGSIYLAKLCLLSPLTLDWVDANKPHKTHKMSPEDKKLHWHLDCTVLYASPRLAGCSGFMLYPLSSTFDLTAAVTVELDLRLNESILHWRLVWYPSLHLPHEAIMMEDVSQETRYITGERQLWIIQWILSAKCEKWRFVCWHNV